MGISFKKINLLFLFLIILFTSKMFSQIQNTIITEDSKFENLLNEKGKLTLYLL